ncbi:unnamed protein product [Amoebophrya sp. A120]|nr:unnamed protein product [Amoebophrya sp. A120]|eukprot:GSA120T00004432001.1
MRLPRPVLLGLAWPVADASKIRSKGDAVGKVVEMLSKMIADGEEGKAKEAAIFKSIEKSVAQTMTEVGIEIEHQKEMVEKYQACKEAGAAEASELAGEIEALQKENADNAAELAAKKASREEAQAAFVKEEKDLMESVDALTRAIQVIKAEPGSVAAIQTSLQGKLPATVQADLEAFVQQPQAGKTAYENQSGGLLQMLEDLLADFSKQLKDAQTGNSNQVHAFQMFKMDMDNEIENIERDISSKTQQKGEAEAKSGECASKEETATDALASAEKLKKETGMYFKAQSDSFAQNQKVRTQELDALNKAVDIMKGDAVTTGADKHIPGLVQKAKSFLQISTSSKQSFTGSKLSPRLQLVQEKLSSVHNSPRLSMISVSMLTGGTFDKIIGMIKEMITTLEEEAAQEQAHKEWCDKELSTTEKDRDTYQGEVDALAAKKEGLEAKKANAQEEIKRLQTETAELKKTVADTTAERTAEKKENEETIAEASAAQQAVAKAIEVLEEFYGGDEEPALLQTKQAPVIASYGGMGGESTGVIGLMQTIEAKFSELESDTKAAEAMASTTYKEFMAVSKKQLEKNRDDLSDTKIEVIKLDAEIARTEKALAGKAKSLKAAQDYWSSLQPMCVVKKVSYEERVAKREEEIAALKEAYKILSEES